MATSIECVIAGGKLPEPHYPLWVEQRYEQLKILEQKQEAEPGTADAFKEEAPKFFLRIPDVLEQAEIDSAKSPEYNVSSGVMRDTRIGYAEIKLLKCSIWGWENHVINNKVQQFEGIERDGEKVGCTLEDLAKLPGSYRTEIYNKIERLRQVFTPDFI